MLELLNGYTKNILGAAPEDCPSRHLNYFEEKSRKDVQKAIEKVSMIKYYGWIPLPKYMHCTEQVVLGRRNGWVPESSAWENYLYVGKRAFTPDEEWPDVEG